MLTLIQKLLDFSGSRRKDLLQSFLLSLLDSLFEMLPLIAILTVLAELLEGRMEAWVPLFALGVMVLSVSGRILFLNLSAKKRTLASFAMCSDRRLEIGEYLKRVPMGYFSEHRPGDIAATVTNTLGDIENHAVTVMEKVAGGFIHALVIALWLLFYEWHIALLMITGLVLSTLLYGVIQKAGKRYAPLRQKAQVNLVTEILEYVKGMSVVKAFGLGNTADGSVKKAISESARANILLESVFSALSGCYQSVFKVVQSAIFVVAPYLFLGGVITPEKCLLLFVASFVIYANVELVGSMTSIARVIEASMERLDHLLDTPLLDKEGRDAEPQYFGISLEHVSFYYGSREVLHDITLTIPEKTSCAIVGPSGSGKSTLVSLMARFWDAQEGRVLVGGRDVKEYTCDGLLKHFSIVFQDVYLFMDTITGIFLYIPSAN